MKNKIILLFVLVVVVTSILPPVQLNNNETIMINEIKNNEKSQSEILYINTFDKLTKQANIINDILMKNRFLSEIDAIKNIKNKQEWFISYKKILNNYSEINKTKTVYDVFSTEEIDIFCHIVEAEVTNGDFLSKVNVANVILNRINNEQFPNTIKEVVFQEGQFAPIIDGRYYEVEVTDSTLLAIEYAYMFEDTTQGALFFESGDAYIHMSYANYLFTDNVGHHFYK